MTSARSARRALALLAGGVLVVAGCQEHLASGAACPTLCPDTLAVIDTQFVGRAAIDSAVTVVGIPPIGSEPQLLVADYAKGGDTVRTVAVIRFDSLTRFFPDSDTTKPPRPLTRFDSVGVFLNVILPSDSSLDTVYVPDTVTFLLYDVDTAANDFDTAAVHARFASAPIDSVIVPPDSVRGTIKIPIDSGFLAPRVRAGQRVRLGLRVRSPRNVQVRLGSTESNNGATLRYFGYADTSKLFVTLSPSTISPGYPTITGLADYEIVEKGTPPPPAGLLAAGGIPSSRVYLHVAIPTQLVDSSATIVRANLILHRAADPFFASTDSLRLLPRLVRATPAVNDVYTATLLSIDPTSLISGVAVPTFLEDPAHAQADTIPLVSIFGLWKAEGLARAQRAIVLQSSTEGLDPRQYYIYSPDAVPDSLRPRILISYIPRSGFGLP